MNHPNSCVGLLRIAAVLGCLGGLPSPGQQNVALVPAVDTTIHEAFPENNFGGGSTFTSGGRNMGGRARALLKFNVAGALPPGATIVSASLTLTVTAANGPESTFELRRLLADWGEGSGSDFGGGSPGGAGEATWNNRLGPGTPWMTAGGDFSTAISASASVNAPGAYTFTGTGLVPDLQL